MALNHIKQLFRMPVRFTLFLLLLVAAATFLSLGGNLFVVSNQTISQYEENFQTIGTVEELPLAYETRNRWVGDLGRFITKQAPKFGKLIPISALDFEGAGYIGVPEKRPYYGSYAPDYQFLDGIQVGDGGVVEMTPLEDCVPNKPVKIKITKILDSAYYNSDETWFWDVFTQYPEPLEKGKTYAVELTDYWTEIDGEFQESFCPEPAIGGSQYTREGIPLTDSQAFSSYYEVTEGFYDTDVGKRFLAAAKANDMALKTQPVVATNNINLLLPFYNNAAYVNSGRAFTELEYEQGHKVCLIPSRFATANNLSVGDSFRVQLYYADYADSPGHVFQDSYNHGLSELNTEGEAYPVFEDSMYTVVGIYVPTPAAALSTDPAYNIGYNEVIIPTRSIENSDENNIIDYGPMIGSNVSFQIPNGTTDEYMEKWAKHAMENGLENLQIQFYDKGYSQIAPGLETMKKLSAVFIALGVTAFLLIMVFFCHLFILKQKMRTAIERLLGISKKKCARGTLFSIMLVVAIGGVIGCTAGSLITKAAYAKIVNTSYYSIEYTVGAAHASNQDDAQNVFDELIVYIAVSLLSFGVMLIFGTIISMTVINRSLRYELLSLLGVKDD